MGALARPLAEFLRALQGAGPERLSAAGELPPATGPGVAVHGDLYFRHLLLDGGRLCGVIDWGDVPRRSPARRSRDSRYGESVHIVSRIFGVRRYERARPSDADLEAVDVTRMIEQARSRGDVRSDDEILAALFLGADLIAERHPDPELRRRAVAAASATRDRLVDSVGEEEAARLVAASSGPIGEDGTTARRPRRGRRA